MKSWSGDSHVVTSTSDATRVEFGRQRNGVFASHSESVAELRHREALGAIGQETTRDLPSQFDRVDMEPDSVALEQ